MLEVAAAIAPDWVECQPPEIEAALMADVPVIATARALGWRRDGVTVIAPGAAEALRRAFAGVVAR